MIVVLILIIHKPVNIKRRTRFKRNTSKSKTIGHSSTQYFYKENTFGNAPREQVFKGDELNQ